MIGQGAAAGSKWPPGRLFFLLNCYCNINNGVEINSINKLLISTFKCYLGLGCIFLHTTQKLKWSIGWVYVYRGTLQLNASPSRSTGSVCRQHWWQGPAGPDFRLSLGPLISLNTTTVENKIISTVTIIKKIQLLKLVSYKARQFLKR